MIVSAGPLNSIIANSLNKSALLPLTSTDIDIKSGVQTIQNKKNLNDLITCSILCRNMSSRCKEIDNGIIQCTSITAF